MAATYSSLVGIAVGGKYEIRRVIGVGGMGVVCEAVHLDLGKKVAIKLIDKTMKESELIVARFRREARAAGQIQSEHIVDVFDVGADARVGLYMVMEHLTGEDLQARMEREKRLEVKTGVMIAHQIARGLAKAHEKGVVHRDLKPANIYLTERDNGHLLVKLLDFGVSKLLGDTGGARITGSGAPIGTPLYMSPEQAEGKDDIDGRADIWSLGAVMYEALAGAPPFADRGSYHGTIVGILTSRPRLLCDAAPWVPPEVARVVDAMLVHDREARLPNATVVTQRLLEAYPAVLPDGTGRHTAVIVPQTQAAVDATGDTEIFTSASMKAAQASRSSSPGSAPRSSGAAPRTSAPPSSAQDSSKTVPDSSTSAEPADAKRTVGATPVEGSLETSRGSDPDATRLTPRGPRTAPLPPANPSSSARGVAMPSTPPVMDPIAPPSEIAPDTTRDDALAVNAERRRVLTLGAIAIAILGVALGGYYAGRHAGPESTPTATTPTLTATTPTPVVTTAQPSTPATGHPAPTGTATPAPPIEAMSAADASVAVEALGRPEPPPAPKLRRPTKPRPTATATATTNDAPTPYDSPEPAPAPPPSPTPAPTESP